MTFSRVFLIAWSALVACAAIGSPLAQAPAWEEQGAGAMVSRVLGFGALGAAMLLLIYAPVFAVLCRLRRVTLTVAALIGAAIPVFCLLLISNPKAESWSEKFTETIQTYFDHPELFVSDWLPFVVGGAIFGLLFMRQPAVERWSDPTA